MNRCSRLYAMATLLALSSTPLLAQPLLTADPELAPSQLMGIRKFPLDAERGTLEVLQFPMVKIGGKQEILPPGVRIIGPNNLLVLGASLTGFKYEVNYRRNDFGQMAEMWLLTPAEAKLPIMRDQVQRRSLKQTRPADKRINPNTPYDQLPTYEQATQAGGNS